jgi:hypothetical protein
LANKNGLKDMQKEMKKIMGNVKDTEQVETEEDEENDMEDEDENENEDLDENEDDNENESMDSDIKIAAYDKQDEDL